MLCWHLPADESKFRLLQVVPSRMTILFRRDNHWVTRTLKIFVIAFASHLMCSQSASIRMTHHRGVRIPRKHVPYCNSQTTTDQAYG